MRHQKSGRKLSRLKDHRKALLANLAVSLINSGRIKTTDAKAKEVRPFVERMVTFAKRGDLHARRIVLSRIGDADAVKKLFEEIGPQFVDRPGGYTRILKLGFRHGDNSPISLIEFVKEDEIQKTAPKQKSSKAKAKPSEKAEVKGEDTTAEETVVEEIAQEETAGDVIEETSAVEETVTEEAPEETVEEAPEEKAEETPAVEEEKAEEVSAVEEEKAEEVSAAEEEPEDKAGNEEESADEKEKSADDNAGEDK